MFYIDYRLKSYFTFSGLSNKVVKLTPYVSFNFLDEAPWRFSHIHGSHLRLAVAFYAQGCSGGCPSPLALTSTPWPCHRGLFVVFHLPPLSPLVLPLWTFFLRHAKSVASAWKTHLHHWGLLFSQSLPWPPSIVFSDPFSCCIALHGPHWYMKLCIHMYIFPPCLFYSLVLCLPYQNLNFARL